MMFKLLLGGIVLSPLISAVSLADTLYDKQFRQRVKQAHEGNRRAQYRLGLAYLQGSEVRVDLQRSIHWFRKSARQGYPKAMYRLGLIYYQKFRTPKLHTRAIKWLKRASGQGHPAAAYHIGRIYFEGKHIQRDVTRARRWARKAQQDGVLRASRLLASINRLPSASAEKPVRRRIETKRKSEPRKIRHVAKRKPTVLASLSLNRQAPVSSKLFATRKLVLGGVWEKNGKPVNYMPSKANNCLVVSGKIRCMTGQISQSNDLYKARVQVESIISNFNSRGTFSVSWRYRYVKVSPQLKTEPGGDSDIPSVGWQLSYNRLRCKIVESKLAKCYSDDLKVERYYSR